jgi:signal transduction histidine kinase
MFATLRRRLAVALVPSLGVGLLLSPQWTTGTGSLVARTLTLGLVGTLAFGLFERWPRRVPPWLPRWVVQVVAVGLAMPLTTLTVYIATTPAGAPSFWSVADRRSGFMTLTFLAVLIAPWTALGALIRQKEAFAREQERQALDARIHLLQAQVAPHFLFNTLANVQALVDAGSPRASTVLRSLTAYLRAAVPLLDQPATTLQREVELVEAYLQLMHMRMPDRLHYEVHVDAAARTLRCPPTTLLTLVENAVRHGIDPSEEGGRIEIDIRRHDGRCVIRVSDTGVGFQPGTQSPGTGLASLRERLQLVFGGDAVLRVVASEPRGVCVELDVPAIAAQ